MKDENEIGNILSEEALNDTGTDIGEKSSLKRKETESSPMSQDKKNELMTSKQVQELFQIGGQCLYLWRKKGLIPFNRIAGKCLYFRDDIFKVLTGEVIMRNRNVGSEKSNG